MKLSKEQREAMLRDLEWPRSRIDDIIRHVRTLIAENERLRHVIESCGNTKDFDWNFLGRMDELEQENERLKYELTLLKEGKYDDSWRQQCEENERLVADNERLKQELGIKPATHFNGQVDEIEVHNRVLAEPEIRLKYLEADNERLRQLMACKNAALAVFADRDNWIAGITGFHWRGEDKPRDPIAYAQRELDRTCGAIVEEIE